MTTSDASLRLEELRAAAILSRAPRLPAEDLVAAARRGAAPSDLVRMRAAELGALGLHELAARAIANPDRAAVEADLAWLESSDVTVLFAASAAFPPLLARIEGAPPVLFVRGDVEALSLPQLAVVGSRNPTAAGRATAREFAQYFARAGLAITSGLARGIDAAAHEGALDGGGPTIAVCGTGIDRVYPEEHAALAERIAANGALVSELPPRSPPRKEHFPRRNRILSGLALGVLVVEAARHSGSLSTAKHAGEQGREIFAIPGSIHSALSRGCHKLIREGAKLVEEAADVLSEIRLPLLPQALARPAPQPRASGAEPRRLDKEYEILLDALGFEPAGIDAIVERTGLRGESVASMLLILELDGRIEACPGGRYCRIPEESQKHQATSA